MNVVEREASTIVRATARLLLPLLVAMTALLAAPAKVFAWEEDVHYGLTKWLALQVGLTERSAERIAQRDVEADEGILDARHLVFWYACLSNDRNASEIVKDHHFPTGSDLPNPPDKRAVEPRGPYALRAVNAEIARAVKPEDQLDSLARFGKGLHALQDSWSHQGEPGIPWLCNKGLAWGHPAKRGGWSSHRADVTFVWPDDTLATAQATCDVLAAYAKAQPWTVTKAPRGCVGLESELQKFVAAKTKAEKADWFRARGFQDITFLRKISLPDGNEPLSRLLITLPFTIPTGPPTPLATVPPDAIRFLQDFWNLWVGSRDYAKIASQYLAASQVVRSFRSQGFNLSGDEDTIARTALAMWRVADHGRVARLGHVPPVPGTPADSEIKNLVADPKVFLVSEGLSQAMLPLGKGGPPLALAPDGKGRYAAFGRFRHAPHDVVMALAERLDRWRIVELVSVVEH